MFVDTSARKRRMMRGNNFGGRGALTGLLSAFEVPFADAGAGVVSLTEIRTNATPTFTRATTAWTRLSTGLWASVASGSPRSYYDDNSVYRGFFCEGARTNIALWCRDQTNAAWAKTSITATQDQTGIDGAVNSATRLTATGAAGTSLQSVTIGSASRVYSVWMKRITGTGTIKLTVDHTGTGFGADVASQINALTWTRVTSANVTVTNPVFGIEIGTSGDEIAVDFSQNEVGLLASSPIATTTVAVARNADILTYPIGNIDITVGAAVVDLLLIDGVTAALGRNVIADSGGTAGYVLQKTSGSDRVQINDGTTTGLSATSVGFTNTVAKKCGSTWGGSTMEITTGGRATVSAAFDGSLGLATALAIGSRGGGSLTFGAMQGLKIFNRKMSSSQLSALTA